MSRCPIPWHIPRVLCLFSVRANPSPSEKCAATLKLDLPLLAVASHRAMARRPQEATRCGNAAASPQWPGMAEKERLHPEQMILQLLPSW